MISDYEQNLLGNREKSKKTKREIPSYTRPTESSENRAANVTQNNNQHIKAKESCFNMDKLKIEYQSNKGNRIDTSRSSPVISSM